MKFSFEIEVLEKSHEQRREFKYTSYGVLLTDNVDPQWLRDCSPRYFDKYIKFTVDPINNQIVIGMQVHRNGKALLKADEKDLLGGNIFFDDLHVEYESGLNEPINERIGTESDDLRIVTDPDIIERIDNVLKSWVVGL